MDPTGFVLGTTEMVGLVTAGGLGLIGLIKTGLLKVNIGKGNNKEKTVDDYSLEACDKKHDAMEETVVAWNNMNQTMLIEQTTQKGVLKMHAKKLEDGTQRMDEMDKKINSVDIGVAILLDRSGGDTRKET